MQITVLWELRQTLSFCYLLCKLKCLAGVASGLLRFKIDSFGRSGGSRNPFEDKVTDKRPSGRGVLWVHLGPQAGSPKCRGGG